MKFQIQYFTFAMLLCLKVSGAAEKNASNIIVSSEIWSYSSYSQQKMGYPLKAGYPAIKAYGVAPSIEYAFQQNKTFHSLSISSTIPAAMSSENGTGENHLISDSRPIYNKTILNYSLWFDLIKRGNFNAKHSFSSGLLFEYRKLTYKSETSEKSSDVNLYLGPCVQLNYNVTQQWCIMGEFDAHFYIPYFNYGRLETFSETGERIFSSAYRAFYYQTNFHLGIKYLIDNEMGIRIGFSKDDLVGFANRKPSFKVNDIIHHKLDRVYAITVGVDF